MKLVSRATLAVALFTPHAVHATVLTLDDALARARREAPAAQVARLRPDEARGRLTGASIFLHDRPGAEAGAGRRDGRNGVTADVDTSLGQTFELGGRRGARIAGATAGLERETASVDDAVRRVLAAVASAFLRTVAAGERI